MESRIIYGDEMHPEINLNLEKKIIQIKGVSRPENPKVYFSSTFEWIISYFDKYNYQELKLEITLDYFNTASSKIILDILELMETYAKKNKNIHVIWCYEEDDDELLEAGEEFFDLIEISHEYKIIE